MFTEAQFTAAMERAVESRGGDYRFPRQSQHPEFYGPQGVPRYTTESGEAACLIGVALMEMGYPVPSDAVSSACGVLAHRVPVHVLYAARAAQIHQDRRRPWSEALAVYRAALTLDVGQAWYDTQSWYQRAVAIAMGEAEPEPSVHDRMAKIIEEMQAFSSAVTSISFDGIPQMTFQINAPLPTAMKGGIKFGGIKPTVVTTPVAVAASKQEHALVA